MADNLGANFANPLCVDSPHGNAESYLAHDVPAWVRAPRTYGRFLTISGEHEPLKGSKLETIQHYLHGDAAAHAVVNPVDVMARPRYPDTSGRIVAGLADRVYYPQLRKLLAACEGAGMEMSWLELPGGHGWQVWSPGLGHSPDWLAAQSHLVRG